MGSSAYGYSFLSGSSLQCASALSLNYGRTVFFKFRNISIESNVDRLHYHAVRRFIIRGGEEGKFSVGKWLDYTLSNPFFGLNKYTVTSSPASMNCFFSSISTNPSAFAKVVMAPDSPKGTGEASSFSDLL